VKQSGSSTYDGNLSAKAGVVYPYVAVGGDICAEGTDTTTAFPKLTSVGGYINAGGADTKIAFPNLTSVGGYIYADGDWSHIKTGDVNAADTCRSQLLSSFEKNGFSFADNILSKIVSRKGNVARIIICGKTRISYLVTDGVAWSHGATLKEARDGLIYKSTSRDTSEFKAWALNKTISKRDAIRAYRAITGACEYGVREWLSHREIPKTITPGKIIKLTEGAYGNKEFAMFFQAQQGRKECE